MKENKILNTLFFTILICFISCGDMEETYRQFIEDGETIYIGKADSLSVRGGKERLEITWLLLSDPKVSKYKIQWNNEADSVTGNINKTEMVDTIRILLDNMPENQYNFDIFLYDDQGHSSIKSSISGYSYGDFYQSSILNRPFQGITRIDSTFDVEIQWSVVPDDFQFSVITYLNSLGVTVKDTILREEEETVLKNIPMKGKFSYFSSYLPEPDALDMFYTPYNEIQLSE